MLSASSPDVESTDDFGEPPAVTRKPVVLCVDDEPPVLSALKRTLNDDTYEVWTTNDPHRAVEWVKAGLVKVLIVDQRMPDMKGTELLQAAQEYSPNTARILLTAFPGDPLVVESRGRAQLALIGKPWDDGALRKVIRERLC